MKNLIKLILIGLLIMLMPKAKAQNAIITKDGNYTSVLNNENNTPTLTGKTYTDIEKKIVYPIYITKKGKLFIIKVSLKTGKRYKSYLKLV